MGWVSNLKQTFGRGIFPQEMSFILDLPLRNFLLSPQKLVARLSLNPDNHVLEVGAGSGFHSVEVARTLSEGHLELLDLQPQMLRKAQQKVAANKLSNVGYALADAGQLSFKEECFDVVFLVTVLGEIRDQKAFLNEAHRVLKQGGLLSVSEHYPDPDFSSFSKVRRLVERAGFEFVEHFGRKWNYTVNFRKS
jgi:ubiquinone/menaquinone biosynthesis C-methylase UbiE